MAMNILFLEDSLIDYELICELLVESGIELLPTHALNKQSYQQALSSQRFDLIVSDYQLPDYNAFDALHHRNELEIDTPFICVSGSIGEELAIDLLKNGAADYVLKDRMSRLPFAIKKAIEEANEREISRATQKALEKSEAKFRHLFENHVAAKLLIDPQTGLIVEANEAALQLVGETSKTIRQLDWKKLAYSSTFDLEEISTIILQEGKIHFESRFIRSDKNATDLEIFASLIQLGEEHAIHAIVHDITDKKKAEEENRLLKKAVESSSISISITDHSGNLIYVNPFFTKFTGYTFDEVRGKNPRFLKSGFQSREFYAEMWQTILSGKVWNGEFQNKRKNGELFWVKAIISPILNQAGEITHFVAVKNDVTEQRRLMDELISAKNKAEESDRLKTAFLHNLSHEIRTPMNSIMGFGHFLASDDLDAGQRHEFYEILDQSSKRLMNTVDDMVEMASVLSGVVQLTEKQVDVTEILNVIRFKYESKCRDKNLQLELQLPDENLKIHTDDRLVLRILEELTDNAVKFTDTGSVVIGCRIEGEMLVVFVKDSGIGIHSLNHAMIFNPFNQEDSSIARLYEGNGLGLSIARGYAQLLGSEIRLDSEAGKGSVFSFSLPYLQAELKTM